VATHPDVVISAIAARSKKKAEDQIKKYKLLHARAYGSYDDLLSDPEIEAVYIPLPNGLHYEWTIKAVKAGKHVLVEKPIAGNASQTQELQQASYDTGKVVLEAFHWRLHPAAHAVRALIESGDYGAVQEVKARMTVPAGAIGKDDIRFQYSLAGGSCMDITYVFSATSYFAVSDLTKAKVEVLEAKPRINARDPNVDDAMHATYTLTEPNGHKVVCQVEPSLSEPWLWGIIPRIWDMPYVRVVLEKATINFPNFPGPWLGHEITVTDNKTGKVVKKLSQYKDGPQWGARGEKWWTTYRYQLEAFVEGVRAVQGGKTVQEVDKGLEGVPWVPLAESVAEIGIIDKVYEKAGLPLRT
jgi:predicted dehydrogenase